MNAQADPLLRAVFRAGIAQEAIEFFAMFIGQISPVRHPTG